MKPTKIWVLFGGISSEREVSLRTGQGILQALRSKGYQAEGFDVKPGTLLELDWKHPPDFVYLGFHGSFGEDGTIQGFLECLNVPYVGSRVAASALCFNKILTKKQAASAGVVCPFSYDIQGERGLNELLSKLPDPKDFFSRKWYLKAARQGSTIGIERFDPAAMQNPEAEFRALSLKVLKFDESMLIEEWVEGAEITVAVLNGKAFPVVEIRPLSHFYDYESKYTKGRTEYLCPAPLSERDTLDAQRYAERAFAALECEDYARADFVLAKDGPKFLEMNTLPGMTETSLVPKAAAAAGLDYAGFVDKVVRESYARWKSGAQKG